MREFLPGLLDADIIKVAQALDGRPSNGGHTGGVMHPYDPANNVKKDEDVPATIAEAVGEILKVSGQATRGEIHRALGTRGWDTSLANGRILYGVLGRVLEGPKFQKVHRGLYRLADSIHDRTMEDQAYDTAKTLKQPFLAHQLAAKMKCGVFQVAAYLKVLKAQGRVKHASKLPSGTHEWKIV